MENGNGNGTKNALITDAMFFFIVYLVITLVFYLAMVIGLALRVMLFCIM